MNGTHLTLGLSPSEYIVFDPRQIKSTDNRGTFDLSDPRMSFNRGPP